MIQVIEVVSGKVLKEFAVEQFEAAYEHRDKLQAAAAQLGLDYTQRRYAVRQKKALAS